jgi:hypothetical protein
LFGLVAVGEVHEHRVAGGALDQGADRGGVVLADDQVALPVRGNGAVISLGGAPGDIDHVGEAVLALPGLPTRAA